jgi:hypothetical protein
MMGGKRIALVGATIDEARAIMVEGVSGLLSIARRQRIKVKWEPGLKRLTWPRGSVAELYSGDSPEGLRGPEHDFAWCACHHRPLGQRFSRWRSDCSASYGSFARDPVPRRVNRSDGSVRRARGYACRL